MHESANAIPTAIVPWINEGVPCWNWTTKTTTPCRTIWNSHEGNTQQPQMPSKLLSILISVNFESSSKEKMANLTHSIITRAYGTTLPLCPPSDSPSRFRVRVWMSWNRCMLLLGDLFEVWLELVCLEQLWVLNYFSLCQNEGFVQLLIGT
jgi:hypothetical protein